jgi:hypothetical protein
MYILPPLLVAVAGEHQVITGQATEVAKEISPPGADTGYGNILHIVLYPVFMFRTYVLS